MPAIIETYTCTKKTYNGNMGCDECWQGDSTVFYCDRHSWVKIGDIVKLERNDNGFYERVWVNGWLMTENDFEDTHSILKKKSDAVKQRLKK